MSSFQLIKNLQNQIFFEVFANFAGKFLKILTYLKQFLSGTKFVMKI